jgi:hypothetical protein
LKQVTLEFSMTDKPKHTDQPETENPSDTLIVPPPNFKERLLAAQRARLSTVRPSVEIPIPPHVRGELPVLASSKGESETSVENSAAIPSPVSQPLLKPDEKPTPAAPPMGDNSAKPTSAEPAPGSV